jgi:hypothetical protein
MDQRCDSCSLAISALEWEVRNNPINSHLQKKVCRKTAMDAFMLVWKIGLATLTPLPYFI